MVAEAERIVSKIPLRRVDASACAVVVGRVIKDGKIVNQGTPHLVHKGEWVEFVPVTSVREFISLMGIMDGVGNEAMSAHLKQLGERLAKRVVRWNWTDMMGESLPQPYGCPDVLLGLSEDELYWLMARSYETEPEDERKNA